MLAETCQPGVLVVDQRLERADVERLHTDPRCPGIGVAGERGADRQPGGLGLATGRRGTDDDVILALQDWPDRPGLRCAQLLPLLIPDPRLDFGMKLLVGASRVVRDLRA